MITINQEQLESMIDNLQGIRKAIHQNLKGIAYRDEGLLFDGFIKTTDLLREFEHAVKNTDKRTNGSNRNGESCDSGHSIT